MTATATTNFAAPQMIVVGLVPIDGDLADLVRTADAGVRQGTVPARHYLPPRVTQTLLGALAPESPMGGFRAVARRDRLTSRERQVVDQISEGLSNKQIATRLGIAIHTVKCHVHNILAKLGVDNRVQVAVLGRTEAQLAWGPELVES